MTRSRTSVECPWCGSAGVDGAPTHCDGCGGALPLPPSKDPGEPPPPAPRTLPGGYTWRRFNATMDWKVIGFFAGIFFWTVFFPLLMAIIYGRGWAAEKRKIAALRTGTAARGEVLAVTRDRNKAPRDDQHPWLIEYAFDTPIGPVSGAVRTYHEQHARFSRGDAVWVVFQEGDAERANSLWPPVV